MRLPIEMRLAVHLAAEAELGIFLGADDAGLGLARAKRAPPGELFPIEETMPMPVTTTRLIRSDPLSLRRGSVPRNAHRDQAT